MPRAQDAFRTEDEHWFVTDKEKKFYRVVRSQPPALITFSFVDRPELVEDFLKPPAEGAKGGARRGSAIAIDRVRAGRSTGCSRDRRASRSCFPRAI